VRVRFVVAHLERGGPIEHTLQLAGAMAHDGVDVGAVCASGEILERFRAAGADATEIPLRSSWDGRRARQVWSYVRGSDVVHAQDRRSGLWVRLGPRPRPGGLRIYTVHGLPDEYLPLPGQRASPGARATLAYRGLDAALCRRADAIVVPSSAFAELLASRLGFPRRKLTVIPHGVDVPKTPISPGSLVGTVSLLEPVKGLDVFLRSAARLSRRRPELRFAIFGSGPEANRLASLARRLGIGERVEFPGYVPRSEALGRLAVFVVSSYVESGPLTLLEAMAAGIPVVATRVGGVPEIAAEGTAQLVPPGDDAALADAIARLLDDTGLRERQAWAARERVLAHYTPEACARATLDLYRRLLAARG
jgi:glycosyltransferase involved in cell wall biosynthesis